MSALLDREIKIAFRNWAGLLSCVTFLVLFITLSGIALGGDSATLQQLAPALVWLAVILSLLMSFHTIFEEDHRDGTLEQLLIGPHHPFTITSCKALAWALTRVLPLVFITPTLCALIGVSVEVSLGLFFSLLIATPALVGFGTLMGALLIGRVATLFLGIIMTSPFIIPILIFGVEAVTVFPTEGLFVMEYQALLGLSLFAIGVNIPAASYALAANLE